MISPDVHTIVTTEKELRIALPAVARDVGDLCWQADQLLKSIKGESAIEWDDRWQMVYGDEELIIRFTVERVVE